MAKRAIGGGEFGAASPPLEAFHIEYVIDPFTGERVIGMVRHAERYWRYDGELPAEDDAHEKWHRIGVLYLQALAAALTPVGGMAALLHPGIWEALNLDRGSRSAGFGWLDISWHEPVRGSRFTRGQGPLGSFWLVPGDRGRPASRRTLVLLAGNVDQTQQPPMQLGSDLGLRIVVQVHQDHVRIHGVTLSGMSSRRALDVVPPADLVKQGYGRHALRARLAEALGTQPPYLSVSTLERAFSRQGQDLGTLIAGGFFLRWTSGSGKLEQAVLPETPKKGYEQTVPMRARVHDFRVEVAWSNDAPSDFRVTRVVRSGYVGSGIQAQPDGVVTVFVADPPSMPPLSKGGSTSIEDRRPTRRIDQLEPWRRDVRLQLGSDNALKDSSDPPLFETQGARRRQGAPEGTTLLQGNVVKVSPLPPQTALRGPGDSQAMERQPLLMSDEQASLETYARASELFRRFEAFGIDPYGYFRFARLPLVQRARPQMTWAPDGELPNAEVRPFIGDQRAGDPQAGHPQSGDPGYVDVRMQLLIKYGSASPQHRRKLPLKQLADTGSGKGRQAGPLHVRAQYLSVACDPRWAWHEFGHVLAFAGTGELEFPFAHSAGDALAAINADPLSELAVGDPESPRRFISFPWIEVPGRSHGRSPLAGYCWCGRRNLVRQDTRGALERFHHDYYGEQLMSSSLFRLYRSLGGDTRGGPGARKRQDAETRLEAADYCTYLIMQAISLIGPDSIAPARTADHFVSAMVEADLATGTWDVKADWPLGERTRRMGRHGGRAHKVVRWAFERQGLYATGDPMACAEGHGQPPAVDVYIADARPGRGPDAGPGGYEPVPLRFSTDEPWLAGAGALRRDGPLLQVEVSNRGAKPAGASLLRAWWGREEAGGIRWCEQPQAVQLRDVPPTPPGAPGVPAQLDLGPTGVPSQPCWFLVSIDAPADTANLDIGQPPPRSEAALRELVALDNNLALAWR